MEDEAIIDDFLENPPGATSSDTSEATEPDKVVDDFLESPEDEKSENEKSEDEKSEDEKSEDEKSEDEKSEDENATGFGFSRLTHAFGSVARRAHDQLAALPTPGGVGLLVFALIFFVWAIVPVSSGGQTRLQLLWLTLTGHTSLATGEAPPEQRPGTPTTAPTATAPTTGIGDGGLPLFYANPFDFGV
jgi:hypothetical protein